MDHLGRVVAGAAARGRERRDQAGEPDRPEVDRPRRLVGRELAIVPGIVAAEVLGVELAAAVHRDRLHPRLLDDPARLPLGVEVREAVDGDRAGKEELHAPAVPAGLLGGQPQEPERSLDVDLVGRLGHELRARRQDGGEMEDRVDLELTAEPLQEVVVPDVARDADGAPVGDLRVERLDVERQDVRVRPGLGETVNEGLAHLPAHPGHEGHRSPRHTRDSDPLSPRPQEASRAVDIPVGDLMPSVVTVRPDTSHRRRRRLTPCGSARSPDRPGRRSGPQMGRRVTSDPSGRVIRLMGRRGQAPLRARRCRTRRAPAGWST